MAKLLNLDQVAADGCQLAEPQAMFMELIIVTSGDPCRTGCAYFDAGHCPAYQKHHEYPKEGRRREAAAKAAEREKQNRIRGNDLIGGQYAGMSIRQIAQHTGLSLNQVRDKKQQGAFRE